LPDYFCLIFLFHNAWYKSEALLISSGKA